MNRFAALIVMAAWPLGGFAQTATTAQNRQVMTVIRLQYARPSAIVEMVGPGSPITIRGDNGMRAVVVKGFPGDVADAERTIRELDVPAAGESTHDIEAVVYVIGAWNKSQPATTTPKEMEPVIKQLQSIFPYASYGLLDTMLLRSREGAQASTEGVMKDAAELSTGLVQAPSYVIQYQDVSVSGEGPKRTIHFNKFRFSAKLTAVNPSQPPHTASFQTLNIGLDTDLDIREGQKVVVGKTNVNGDSALFVVLTARVLE